MVQSVNSVKTSCSLEMSFGLVLYYIYSREKQ